MSLDNHKYGDLLFICVITLIGLFGGTAKYAHSHRKYTWQTYISQIMISMLTAFVTGLLLQELNCSENIIYSACGIAGYLGASLLDTFGDFMIQYIASFSKGNNTHTDYEGEDE